jgi:hypothetical protein
MDFLHQVAQEFLLVVVAVVQEIIQEVKVVELADLVVVEQVVQMQMEIMEQLTQEVVVEEPLNQDLLQEQVELVVQV